MLSDLLRHSQDSLLKGVKNVLLVDASIVRQTGIGQEQERIHLCYSLNQNRMNQIKVTDHHTAESLTHFPSKRGSYPGRCGIRDCKELYLCTGAARRRHSANYTKDILPV